MNSRFIMLVRKLTTKTKSPFAVTNEEIKSLEVARYDLEKEIENTIIKNEKIGERQLVSNIEEILQEREYTATITFHSYRKLEEKGEEVGLYNIRAILENVDDALTGLLQLMFNYFPEKVKLNQKLFKKFGTLQRIAFGRFSGSLQNFRNFPNLEDGKVSLEGRKKFWIVFFFGIHIKTVCD